MAPKHKGEAPVVSPATLSEGLGSSEQPVRLAALNSLLELPGREADLVRHGVPAKLLQLLASQDRAAQAATAKLLAKYASSKGHMSSATGTSEFWDGMWAVLEEHQAVLSGAHLHSTSSTSVGLHASIGATGNTSPQRGAAPAARKPAAVVKEEEEMGPSKLVLEPVLRALTSRASASQDAAAMLCQKPPQALIGLLSHPSPRVQMRAERLLFVLLRTSDMQAAMLAAGAVPVLIKLVKSPSAVVQVAALKALNRLARDCSPQLVQMQQHGLLDVLLAALSEPIVPVAVVPVATGGKGKAAAGQSAADASKQAAKMELQLATCMLLAQLCSSSPALCEQLMASGGLLLLHKLLPECPVEKQTEDLTSSDAEGVIASIAMEAAPAPTSNSSPGSPNKPGARPGSAVATRPASAQQPATPPEEQPPAKVSEPRAHAKLLEVLATLAGHPAGSTALLEQQESGTVPWIRQLLHSFAPAPAVDAGVEAAQEAAAAVCTTAKGKMSTPATPKGDRKGVPVELPPAPIDQPPFAACVKAGALRCLAQLCQHPGHASAVQAQAGMVAQMMADLQCMEPAQLVTVVDDAARLMHVLAEGAPAGHSQEDVVAILKVLALHAQSPEAMCLVARAVLALPEELFIAPPRPPLPSPPPTPPPPPLPTSQFAWDALGRPMVTDGMTLQAVQ